MARLRKQSGTERRVNILNDLEGTGKPVSATKLGDEYGVTRQVIVSDIALLRAEGASIISTNRGYMMANSEERPRRTFELLHEPGDAARELSTIIDQGGTVLDVQIEHPTYGPISAPLNVGSPASLRRFMNEYAPAQALARLTKGHHRHTVEAATEEDLDAIETALRTEGFLTD